MISLGHAIKWGSRQLMAQKQSYEGDFNSDTLKNGMLSIIR